MLLASVGVVANGRVREPVSQRAPPRAARRAARGAAGGRRETGGGRLGARRGRLGAVERKPREAAPLRPGVWEAGIAAVRGG